MSALPWIEAPSPNHGDARWAAADGVVVHSTRGGAEPGIEFDATLRWFANPASQVSAHVVIGRDGRRAHVVAPDLVAWHARGYNGTHLGAELEQPTADWEYTDAQYRLLALWVLEMHQEYGFPLVAHGTILSHSEIDPQKSDPGPTFSWPRFLSLLGTA